MKPIYITEEDFYELSNCVGENKKAQFDTEPERGLKGRHAMSLLNIKSKTTLQKLPDEGRIRFSQPAKKIILYDRLSILKCLDDHAVNI